MRRLRLARQWLHDHPMVVDGWWAAWVSLFSLSGLGTGEGFAVPMPWVLAWHAAMLLPLVWRRTRPDAAMAVVALGCLAQLWLTDTVLPVDLVPLLMLYAVAAYGRTPLRWWWLGLAIGGSLLGALDWSRGLPAGAPASTGQYATTSFIGTTALAVASFVPGALARQRKDMMASLRDRAESLERERDSSARLAAQEERARIAREMHDVVAHSLSVIVVQSDGAAYAVEHGDPAAVQQVAARTLATIGDTARTALAETRRLVGVLRDSDESPDYAPSATLDQVDDLVAHVRAAGMPASLTVVGDPAAHAPLDAAQQMAAYRVVQEALTNAMKHAGPGARVDVEITHHDSALALAVRDTGGGSRGDDGRGHGLIGMRERMTALGGDFVARGRAAGGFEVLASLPLGPVSDAGHEGER